MDAGGERGPGWRLGLLQILLQGVAFHLQGVAFNFQGVAFRLEPVGTPVVGAAAGGQGHSGRCRYDNA